MAKYVFDFEKVNNAVNIISERTQSMNENINNYSNKIENSISSWDSITKNNFVESNNKIISFMRNSVNDMETLGKYLSTACTNIEALEESLSSINI